MLRMRTPDGKVLGFIGRAFVAQDQLVAFDDENDAEYNRKEILKLLESGMPDRELVMTIEQLKKDKQKPAEDKPTPKRQPRRRKKAVVEANGETDTGGSEG